VRPVLVCWWLKLFSVQMAVSDGSTEQKARADYRVLIADKTMALEAIAAPLETPYPNPAPSEADPDPATCHILDLGYAVRTYKTLLAGGRFSTTTNTVEDYDEKLGNATFALVELLSELKDDKEKLAVIKQTLCGKEILPDIEKSWRKGAKPLYDALVAL
jgi:pumilio family protein 6